MSFRLVMTSGLVPYLISLLTPDPEFGLGAAVECAWCLHYIVAWYVVFFPLIVHKPLSYNRTYPQRHPNNYIIYIITTLPCLFCSK